MLDVFWVKVLTFLTSPDGWWMPTPLLAPDPLLGDGHPRPELDLRDRGALAVVHALRDEHPHVLLQRGRVLGPELMLRA